MFLELVMLNIFSCVLAICMSSLKTRLFRFSTHFFDWTFFFFFIFNCTSCLCILEINPLLVASFADIFSHSVGCLFVSFAVLKILSLIRSHLFIFGFNFYYCRKLVKQGVAEIYIRECSAYVFL